AVRSAAAARSHQPDSDGEFFGSFSAKARDIAKSFGYTERPVDTLSAWNYDPDYFRYASHQKDLIARDVSLAPYPPALYFWYRQSPHHPINSELDYDIYSFNRDTLEPGMQAVVLDSEGRLLEFHARPAAEIHAGIAHQPLTGHG